MKKIIDNRDLIEIKNFCSVIDKIRTMRRLDLHWEEIFAKDTSDQRLLAKIYKEL